MNRINTKIANIILEEDDIFRVQVKDGLKVNVNDVKEIVEFAGKVGNGRQLLYLILVPSFSIFEDEVRAYTASEPANAYTKATAFVSTSISMQILGNFYIDFHKPCRPTKIFSSVDKAIAWLKAQK